MDDHDFAAIALDQGKKSQTEGPGKPLVGVVIVKDGGELGRSFRGRTGAGQHAEFGLIRELQGQGADLTGAVVYTTLEPCSTRNHPKVPCAEHLAAAGVAEVVIGMYDPNPRIYRDGGDSFAITRFAFATFPRTCVWRSHQTTGLSQISSYADRKTPT